MTRKVCGMDLTRSRGARSAAAAAAAFMIVVFGVAVVPLSADDSTALSKEAFRELQLGYV